MADDGLRLLERAAAGGDVEAVARVLHARVRSGQLAQVRLELAAYAGDVAAQLALGDGWERRVVDEGTLLPQFRPELQDYVRGFARYDGGGVLAVRVAVAACRVTWDRLHATHSRQRPFHQRNHGLGVAGECSECDGLDEPRGAIVAAEAWLLCPCRWHKEAAAAAGQMVGEDVRWWGMLACSVEAAGTSTPATGARCARLCVAALSGNRPPEQAAAQVRAGIRNAVIGWALAR